MHRPASSGFVSSPPAAEPRAAPAVLPRRWHRSAGTAPLWLRAADAAPWRLVAHRTAPASGGVAGWRMMRTPVGTGPFGQLDMAGNVWEWVDPDGGGDQPCIVRGTRPVRASAASWSFGLS